MSTPYAGSERQAANDASLNQAEHHRETWTETELEVLSLWDHTEDTLHDLAELLGRSIEACRQRYYIAADEGFTTRATRVRRAASADPVRSRTAEVRVHVTWLDDDEWPDYYVRG